MFIASANVNDDRRAQDREVLEYECCSDIVDYFQSMHSFVARNKPQTNTNNTSPAVAGIVTSSATTNTNNNNNANYDATVSPVTSPQAYSTFPGDQQPHNNNNNNVNATGENNNNNNTANATTTSSGDADNLVNDAISKMQQNNNNSIMVMNNAGESVDTTQSAVFKFPAAGPFDSIKPVYLVRQVGPLLTLVVGMKNENVDSMRSSTEYNINLLETALMKILALNEEILRNSS